MSVLFQYKSKYYFNDKIKVKDFDYDDCLLDEKSYEKILFYNISYRTLIGAKPLLIRLDIVDGFIRVYDETRYSVLIGIEKI